MFRHCEKSLEYIIFNNLEIDDLKILTRTCMYYNDMLNSYEYFSKCKDFFTKYLIIKKAEEHTKNIFRIIKYAFEYNCMPIIEYVWNKYYYFPNHYYAIFDMRNLLIRCFNICIRKDNHVAFGFIY